MKSTLRDVALASGVSAMTVSKVLNGASSGVRVSKETAERIQKIARELAYQPNTVARSLRSRRTSTIGVVFQHFTGIAEDNPYHPQLLNGIMRALFPRNYTLALCPSLVQGKEAGSLSDGRFDGILWARPDFSPKAVENLRVTHTPLVMIHAPENTLPGIPAFCVDNTSAMRLAVDHLAQLGHRQIAFLADPINERTTEGVARADAFRMAAGLAGMEYLVSYWDGKTASFAEFLRHHPLCSGICSFSDTLAGHVLLSCRELGLDVPRDLSVIGFDSSSFCDRTVPPLTSLRQEVDRIAFDAATHLLDIIESDPADSTRLRPAFSQYTCELDVRASTGSPSSRKHFL